MLIKSLSDFMSGCKCISTPDFSKWETSSVKDMSYMFSNCINIPDLSGIENWDISNVTNLSHIFENCSSLLEIPDIGKWNTSKVTDFSYMFSGCKILKKIPESIKSWNIDSAMKIGCIFKGCVRLDKANLGEIFKNWKLEKIIDKNNIFGEGSEQNDSGGNGESCGEINKNKNCPRVLYVK